MTGLSDRRTSLSKVASVTSATAMFSNLRSLKIAFDPDILARQ
jgi:hypothetical protein